jgi:hypothetical protein|tara:strand:+ start:307 stop:729 length:423 start_codon:yes stop_codon:yes gene_type:complete
MLELDTVVDHSVEVLQDKIDFYNQDKFVKCPYHPSGFTGTWNFTSHRAIPEVLLGFIQRHFGHYRITRIKLDDINDIMNELWEGPGSLSKIFLLENDMRIAGKDVRITAMDLAKVKVEEEVKVVEKKQTGMFDSLFDSGR